ncbi:MAG TPA: lysyl oxidase family protein [Candidatus Binatia bacterium]|nr:lysyl oxidase family protein [Candidatus Binatia bacterium]
MRLAVLVSAFVLAVAGRAAALPDLTPEIFDVAVETNATVDPGDVAEGCAGAQTGRRLLSFSLRTRNLGPDDLVMGDPGCPDCSLNPGAPCANPLYECSTAHGHPHFEGFAAADLLDAANQVVVSGHKAGFCLLDLECATPQYDCGFQGITAGCADVYAAGLPCQYIDLTDAAVPDGDYTLRVTLDADGAIPEANETNNVVSVPVHVGAPPPPPPTTCPVYTATDLPRAIPDLGSAVSTLVDPRAGTVDRVRIVELEGTHTYVGDLRFRLWSPQGTTVTVMDRVCGGAPDFHLDLADQATTTIPCPPTDGGLHLPSNPLAAFTGQQAGGTWTLQVDDLASQDAGTLVGWRLEVCTTCGNGTLDAGETCDDGNADDGDCCSSNCQTAAGNGTPCDDPASCTAGGTCQGGACAGGSVTCDPCLACEPPLGCVPPTNVLCDAAPAPRASIRLRKRAGDPERDSVAWKWVSGAPVALLDYGSPTTVTDLTLCVFDQQGLRLSLTAPAGGLCRGRPCWTATDTRLKYGDRDLDPDGVAKLQLGTGAPGRARIVAAARGQNMDMPPLGLTSPVTVRLKRSGGPACWESRFPAALRNDALEYRARTP